MLMFGLACRDARTSISPPSDFKNGISMQLSVRDVVSLFKVPEKTVYHWIKENEMPAVKVGEQYRFGRTELLEWAMARQIKVPSDIFNEPDSGAGLLPGFAAALEAGGVFSGVVARDRESALRAVVQNMTLPEDVDRDFLYDVLLAREALGSTGMGDGIAIPHVRNPMVLQVPCAVASLTLLAEPVEFGAVDGKPVYALFSLISPTVRAHLHLLSRLAFTLRDEGFKGAIMRRAPAAEILDAARRVESNLAHPIKVTMDQAG
jgi:PTS system nitrogen regulatory IIA component